MKNWEIKISNDVANYGFDATLDTIECYKEYLGDYIIENYDSDEKISIDVEINNVNDYVFSCDCETEGNFNCDCSNEYDELNIKAWEKFCKA